MLSADLMAGSTAELIGVASTGLLVGAFGVRWTIVSLGLGVAAAACALALADRGSVGERPPGHATLA